MTGLRLALMLGGGREISSHGTSVNLLPCLGSLVLTGERFALVRKAFQSLHEHFSTVVFLAMEGSESTSQNGSPAWQETCGDSVERLSELPSDAL